MTTRPLVITVIGWLFIAAGVTGLVYHAREFDPSHPLALEFLGITTLRLVAIVGGAMLLRRSGLARWVLVGWMGFHVVVSFFHSPVEIAMHAVFFVVLVYLLFWHPAARYLSAPPAA
ncbi:MAG: hypothetical protein U0163_04415 [Gemmatimonadaceae bacterium]